MLFRARAFQSIGRAEQAVEWAAVLLRPSSPLRLPPESVTTITSTRQQAERDVLRIELEAITKILRLVAEVKAHPE